MTPGEFNRTALNPRQAVVVEACAGSGKTWLLVSRMVRLLLDEVAPSEILAITFTRKAAREMRARLDDWLRFMATAEDDAVRAFLAERALPPETIEALLPRARGLFEAVLNAQPGITISTFHAWFLTVIERAPLEAGLAGFSLAEQTHALEAAAWDALADDLARAPTAPLALAMQGLLADIGLYNTRALLSAFLARRGEWWAFTEGQPDRAAYAVAQLEAALPVAPDADVAGALLGDAAWVALMWEYLKLLGQHTPTSIKMAQTCELALSANASADDCFDTLCAAILTQHGEIRKTLSYSVTHAKKMGECALLRLLELHQTVGARLMAAQAARQTQRVYQFNRQALRLGDALLEHYQALKHARRVLDFADVEWQVARLLSDSDQAEYLQYKLDARYRHILLDEFQDTNPLQWRVLQSWFDTAEQAGRMPTVFLVGDPKQSIYRFRGAEAQLFDLAGNYLTGRGAAYLTQHTTRRSAPPVVQAVNQTFAAVKNEYALFRPHAAHDAQRAGRVEVLALAQAPEQAVIEHGYRNPLTTPYSDADTGVRELEAQQLARRLNQIIGHWLIDDETTGARRAEYRDVMILVRSRTHLPVYERALKAARIPFATTRRGGLLDALEVGDLLSLLAFLTTPDADLHLARVLRAPLFDCADTDLLMLAGAEGDTWRQRLRTLVHNGHASPALQRAATLLTDWHTRAGRLPVHDLLDNIYFTGEVQARYAAAAPTALIPGIHANLDALMELALTIEGGRYPSLPRFLHEIDLLQQTGNDASPDEGKTAQLDNAVTLHTIHGAKGLEAPIVWLLDAGARKARTDAYTVLTDWPPGAARPAHFSVYGDKTLRASFQADFFDAEARHAQRENFNLLYVAMTRARQALIVSGASSKSQNDNWHGQILAALRTDADAASVTFGADLDAPMPASTPVVPAPATLAALSAGLNQPQPTGRRIAPVGSSEISYGIVLHAILERITPPARAPAAMALKTELGNPAEFDSAWQHAQRLLGTPLLARFFDPGQYCFAHNELTYLDAHGESRRIDRVVGLADAVWVLDYKSGSDASAAQLATRHRAQLEDYRTAIRHLHPGQPVRCAVIAADGRMIEIE
ncbi:double-strand break repair helicase AddA [Sulfuriferula plumbiphila]|uniref:DNA 3'-5' helicase n=1 Tax=Sulfuriferula plumbiphila TaxID=171865 RepID=A0A512L9J1_9PROT|nr:UvrD-helicase domain-containing protein [Sulfuriferula plumbiphila]BBP06003.1 double-strand break repair helicase AddA [Sulfuriferula plumbiphila]GEP31156.1 double-strand break repair helicase AddA [Sulfuriferula plumbiphila]